MTHRRWRPVGPLRRNRLRGEGGVNRDGVNLVRVDAETDVWRFYSVWVEADLFAPARLVRFWGRIGARGGQCRVEPYEDPERARRALEKTVAQKVRRGYSRQAG
ncbi:hypothetical protein CCR79_13295 [Halorhodospira halophila]|nr:hypothetical protein [Halorhodospira halophila]